MSIKYENKDVMIDATRYVVNGKTYPINNITSVETGIVQYKDIVKTEYFPSKGGWAWWLPLMLPIPGAMIGATYSFYTESFIDFIIFTPLVAVIFYVLGLVMEKKIFQEEYSIEHRTEVPHDYAVRVTTAGGQVDSYKSKDQDIVDVIVEAINQAIIERG